MAPSTRFPEELGEGGVHLLGMQGGFLFCAIDSRMTSPSRAFFTEPSDPQERLALLLLVSLQGTLGIQPGGHRRSSQLAEHSALLCQVTEPTLTVELLPTRQRAVDVGISRSALQRVAADMKLPAPLLRLAEGEAIRPLTIPGRIDQSLGLIMRDLVSNPYTHGAARLYQEAKGLEILALLVDALDDGKSRPRTRWKQRDIELLHEAKRRLTCDLENTPTLEDLSRQIGMSATKLKQGFRDLFDSTVSDTVRDARLQRACTLLESSDLPLKSIASQCGFSDAASLSHAFYRRFARTPGSVRCR